MAFVIKAALPETGARTLSFPGQKTMYGGKQIAAGDTVYIFESGNGGGEGLLASGTVISAERLPREPGAARQTPRVSVTIARTATAKRRLGRAELKGMTDWTDGRAGTELNFKLYRQATDKIAGISEGTAAFLATFF